MSDIFYGYLKNYMNAINSCQSSWIDCYSLLLKVYIYNFFEITCITDRSAVVKFNIYIIEKMIFIEN